GGWRRPTTTRSPTPSSRAVVSISETECSKTGCSASPWWSQRDPCGEPGHLGQDLVPGGFVEHLVPGTGKDPRCGVFTGQGLDPDLGVGDWHEPIAGTVRPQPRQGTDAARGQPSLHLGGQGVDRGALERPVPDQFVGDVGFPDGRVTRER